MYGKVTGTAGASGVAGLAYTGFDAIWWVVGGLTLIFAGVALVKLLPKWRKRNSQ